LASKKNKSALKRQRQNLKRRESNKSVLTAIKTQVKKTRQAIQSSGTEAAATELKAAQSLLSKAAAKGIVHKNNASRRASRLAKKLSKASQAAS
jgi:small subunit ribosomal protein S20